MKTILKLMAGFLGGAFGALLIVGLIRWLMGELTWSGLQEMWQSGEMLHEAAMVCMMFVFALLSFLVHVILHEGGHLVCGLASGYRFLSFRIFSLTLLRIDGKFRLKRFALAGTGGQCLMIPPSKPDEEIPTTLYHLGGIISTFVFTTLLLIAYIKFPMGELADRACFMFIFVGIILFLLNAIPFGANDMQNAIAMRNPNVKRLMLRIMRINAAVQEGKTPTELPAEWFVKESIDYSKMLEVNFELFRISYGIEQGKYEEAISDMEHFLSHKKGMIQLLQLEGKCELLYLYAVTGRIEQARQLMEDKQLMDYITAYEKSSSSKSRILMAVALKVEDDREKALRILEGVEKRADQYLMQGEVKADLKAMKSLL